MNSRKVIIALAFALAGIIAVNLFWKQTFFLIGVLIVLAISKQKIVPIKRAFVWFIIVGLLGPASESIAILFGGSPWAYAAPSLLGVPLWLFPLYGLAGGVVTTLYQGVLNSK